MDQHSAGLGDHRDPLQVNPRDVPVSNSPVMELQGHTTKPESFACLFSFLHWVAVSNSGIHTYKCEQFTD